MSDKPDASSKKTEPDEPAEAAADAKPSKPQKAPKAPKPAKPAAAAKAKGKGFNWVLVLVPVALIAALVLACTLPPTRAILAKTPLKPLLARLPGGSTGAKSKATPDPVAEAKRLGDQVQAAQKAAASKDAQIAALQSQVSQLNAPPSASPTPSATPTAAAVTDEVKRVAVYWAGMDADKAAAIVKQLPDPYVKLVFSQMPPDAVSDIMSELPAKTAARLTAGDAPAGAP